MVVDAMTGQDAVNAAQSLRRTAGYRLGVMLSPSWTATPEAAPRFTVRAVTGKPIKFAGTGEKLDQIEPFHPDRMASRILGMGDVLTLIEKAEAAFDQKKAEELEQKLRNPTNSPWHDLLRPAGAAQEPWAPCRICSGMMPGMRESEERQGGREALMASDRSHHPIHDPLRAGESQAASITAASAASPPAPASKVEEVNRLLKSFEHDAAR